LADVLTLSGQPGDKAKGDRPRGDRPRGDKAKGDKARKPKDGKAKGDKARGDATRQRALALALDQVDRLQAERGELRIRLDRVEKTRAELEVERDELRKLARGEQDWIDVRLLAGELRELVGELRTERERQAGTPSLENEGAPRPPRRTRRTAEDTPDEGSDTMDEAVPDVDPPTAEVDTTADLEAAPERAPYHRRPEKLVALREAAIRLRADGMSLRQVAERLEVPKSTVHRILQGEG